MTTLNKNRSSWASGSGYVPSCSIGPVFFGDFSADHVGRHEIGGELNPVEIEGDCPGECLDEKRFSQTWNAAATGSWPPTRNAGRTSSTGIRCPMTARPGSLSVDPQVVRHLQYRVAGSG
jgi:hypothetical protein